MGTRGADNAQAREISGTSRAVLKGNAADSRSLLQGSQLRGSFAGPKPTFSTKANSRKESKMPPGGFRLCGPVPEPSNPPPAHSTFLSPELVGSQAGPVLTLVGAPVAPAAPAYPGFMEKEALGTRFRRSCVQHLAFLKGQASASPTAAKGNATTTCKSCCAFTSGNVPRENQGCIKGRRCPATPSSHHIT